MKINGLTLSLIPLFIGGAAFGQTYNFLLSGSQATTLETATGSAAYATAELSGSELSYNVVHEGTSGVTAAHFHGPAGPGTPAGVAQGISAGPSPMTGSETLTSGQISDLTAGDWYLNLHTSESSGGELRGQTVQQLSFTPNLLISGAQAGTNSVGAGAARISYDIDSNLLSWDIAWEGLDSGVTMMHFHGPAGPGSNAGVEVDIGGISGLASESSGSTTISDPQEEDLLDGLWYINIHTNDVGSGEIRGQVSAAVVPEPSTYAILAGLFALGWVIHRRRRLS